MNTQKIEIILSEDGRIIRRSTNDEDVQISQAIIDQMSSGVIRSFYRVFEVEEEPVKILCDRSETSYFSMPVKKIPLKAPFKIDDGILYPKFSASKEPVFPMEWIVPQDMSLVLIIQILNTHTGVLVSNVWLLALDSEQRCYRLPMGNIFEDGRLCVGDMRMDYKDAYTAVCAVWNQIKVSEWNGDLDLKPDETRSLFRFMAKNEGFEQQPPLQHWKELCEVIAPPILKIILP